MGIESFKIKQVDSQLAKMAAMLESFHDGVGFDLAGHKGDGRYEVRILNDELALSGWNAEFNDDLEVKIEPSNEKDWFLLVFQFSSMTISSPRVPHFKDSLGYNSVFIISSNTECIVNVPAGIACLQLSIHISRKLLNEILNEIQYRSKYLQKLINSPEPVFLVEPLIQPYIGPVQEVIIPPVSNDLVKTYFLAKAQELIVLLFQTLHKVRSVTQDDYQKLRLSDQRAILALLDYVDEHIHQQISIDDLSHKAGFSKSKLQQVFNQVFGRSVYDYVLDVKMQRSRILLGKPGNTISDAAYATGFENLSHFSTTFKKHFGFSPREYQKQFIGQ